MSRTPLPGSPYPLGAKPNSKGTNFALYSEQATGVELCLFDQAGKQTECIKLQERTAHVFHGFLPGIKPGQRYGYRVDGPWDPAKGFRFNKAKLLVDPYAEALCGDVDYKKPIFPYDLMSGDDTKMDDQDSAAGVPKSIVVAHDFDWGNDCKPQTPLADSVIYEVHVRGYSKRNPMVPENLRGTYAGLAHPASINYLKKLGITAVELLPVHHFIDDGHLLDLGLRNYWGYNTLGYFAPMSRYSSCGDNGCQVNEFKQMVKDLHAAGLEVILDVVYNHTCEGNQLGPMLSFKGIDNTTYYRMVQDNPRFYMDYTGTGNTLNVHNPQVLKLLMDSLRYWVTEMHVDGFRFDLAATLARELHEVSKLSAFFDTIHQDPVLAEIKLIAEPWDVGDGGYQVGQFPILWAEWNGLYRDTVRRFWKGDEGQLSNFAYRLTGSSDLYQYDGRKPYASINFITAHDGFTLTDLVSYNEKHNEANGENNQDGANNNDSWNMGVEGPTDDPAINELRERQVRNFLATLILSQGVPMINGGDEVGRANVSWTSPPSSSNYASPTPTCTGASSSRIVKSEAHSCATSPGTTPTATNSPTRTGNPPGASRLASCSTAPPSTTPTKRASRSSTTRSLFSSMRPRMESSSPSRSPPTAIRGASCCALRTSTTRSRRLSSKTRSSSAVVRWSSSRMANPPK
jgi:isoamylase